MMKLTREEREKSFIVSIRQGENKGIYDLENPLHKHIRMRYNISKSIAKEVRGMKAVCGKFEARKQVKCSDVEVLA